MAKILIAAGFSGSLRLFRGELIKSWIEKGFRVTAVAPGNDAELWLKTLGVKYYQVPLERKGLNPVKDLLLLLRLIRVIKAEKPDFVFLYTIKPVIYGSLAAFFSREGIVFSMVTGLGYVFTEGSTLNIVLKKIVTWLYRIALKNNRKVFFQNRDDIAVFTGLKIIEPLKTVLINGSGVDLDYYHPLPLPEGRISFLMISRLLVEKGVREFIEAAGIVKNQFPEVDFAFVGWDLDDGLSSIEAEELDKWKKEGVVKIYGETKDVRPFIGASSVYVLPSYREGTPRTVLEAMSMSRAVITTDVPGCRETVEDGVNGFLVPMMNSKALAEAMKRFIADPGLIKKMGKESRRIAEEKYDVHQVNLIINRTMGIE